MSLNSQFYGAKLDAIFAALSQNARQSGASRVSTVHAAGTDDGMASLEFSDKGLGVSDPQTLLILGESGRRRDESSVEALREWVSIRFPVRAAPFLGDKSPTEVFRRKDRTSPSRRMAFSVTKQFKYIPMPKRPFRTRQELSVDITKLMQTGVPDCHAWGCQFFRRCLASTGDAVKRASTP